MAAKPKFKRKRASDFDFKGAEIYRKTAELKKSQVKIATKRQQVVTKINGIEETQNVARLGDHIITGGSGERYVMRPAEFKRLYELDGGRPARYRSKSRVRALRLTENVEIVAPWGEKQRALKGGVVVQRVGRPQDVYLIEKRAFRETYAPAPPKPAAKSVNKR